MSEYAFSYQGSYYFRQHQLRSRTGRKGQAQRSASMGRSFMMSGNMFYITGP